MEDSESPNEATVLDDSPPRRAADYLALPLAPFVLLWDGLKSIGNRFFDLATWLDPAKGLGALGRLLRPLGVRIAAVLDPIVTATHRMIRFLFGWVAPLTDAITRLGRAIVRAARRASAAVERSTRALRRTLATAWRSATAPTRWIAAQTRRVWARSTAPIRRLAAQLRKNQDL